MKTYNFAKTENTKTFFWDCKNERFCDNEQPYKTVPIKIGGEWFQTEGAATKKIIVDKNLSAQETDKIINKVL